MSLRLFAFIAQLALCILSNCFVISQQKTTTTTLNVLMPNVAPHTVSVFCSCLNTINLIFNIFYKNQQKDTYLCHKFKLDQDNLYISKKRVFFLLSLPRVLQMDVYVTNLKHTKLNIKQLNFIRIRQSQLLITSCCLDVKSQASKTRGIVAK